MLAQAQLFHEDHDEWPIVILDDLPSELDLDHQRRVLEWLGRGCEQALISGVELPDALCQQSIAATVFHVEHGGLRGLL